MDSSMQTVLNTFGLGDHFFLNDIFTLDEDVARREPTDNTTPIIWLTGHLLSARRHLLGLVGDGSKFEWATQFDNAYDPDADYPSMAKMKDAWVEISEGIKAGFATAAPGDFDKAIDWNLPNQDKTVRGAMLFYLYHEGWHLGQIAYARKAMGMKGLVER